MSTYQADGYRDGKDGAYFSPPNPLTTTSADGREYTSDAPAREYVEGFMQGRTESRKDLSLSDIINARGQLTLSDDQRAGLVGLLTYRCRARTVARLDSVLRYPSQLSNYGIFDRVMILPRIQYIAGQSYPDEIRTVRELLICK